MSAKLKIPRSFLSEVPPQPPVPGSPMPPAPASSPDLLAGWLISAGVVVVSARSLGTLGVPSPKRAYRALTEAGQVAPSTTRGVGFLIGSPGLYAVGDPDLVAHLHASPGSRATQGPRMLPTNEGWVARESSVVQYCLPPRAAVPAGLLSEGKASLSRIHRWDVRTPLLWHGMAPCWRYETEIVYIAARPRRYALTEMHDYLWDLSHASVAEHLAAELQGQPRSVWMRTCLLLRYGCRRDLAAALLAAAPGGSGPYYFNEAGSSPAARSERRRQRPDSPPIWHPDLQLWDFTVDDLLGFRTARYGAHLPAWAVLAYRSGRPDGCPAPPELPDGYPAELDPADSDSAATAGAAPLSESRLR